MYYIFYLLYYLHIIKFLIGLFTSIGYLNMFKKVMESNTFLLTSCKSRCITLLINNFFDHAYKICLGNIIILCYNCIINSVIILFYKLKCNIRYIITIASVWEYNLPIFLVSFVLLSHGIIKIQKISFSIILSVATSLLVDFPYFHATLVRIL